MLHLVTFGGLALESVNDAVEPRLSAQRLAILAVLAAEGDRRVSRERLTGLFWPDAEEERARHSLRQALYTLRSEIGHEVLRADFALSIDATAMSSDVARFRDALARGDKASAAQLVRGPFLEGFYLIGAAPFQRWVEEERARLHAAATAAIGSLASEASAANEFDVAIGWWRRLTELDPLDGRFALGYLQALAARGDRAKALDYARQHAALIRRELEAEPDPEILRLEASLRATLVPRPPMLDRGDNGQSAASRALLGVTVEVSPTGSSPSASPRRRPSRLTRIVLAAGVVATIGFITWTASTRPQDEARASDAIPVVAVGVIRDDGSDSARLGRLLTDMLSTNLASVPGLRVIANSRLLERIPAGQDTSAAAYVEAARNAGATDLLEGRVVEARGDVFMIEMRRVDLRTGLLKGAYRATAPTRFRLVDSVTSMVARHLELSGPPAPPADVTTRSLTAYRLYQEGVRAYYQFDDDIARQMMRAALEDDSTFAMAAYYDALLTDSPMSSAPSDRALRLAARASERERLLITVDLLSYLLGSPRALPIADTLAARYPNDSRALAAVARARHLAGDWPGELQALERAVTIDSTGGDPTSPCYLCHDLGALAEAYFWADSVAAAVRVARRYAQLRPDWAGPWAVLTWGAARQRDSAATREALRNWTMRSPHPRDAILESRVNILLDQYDDIENGLKLLLESPKQPDFLEARWWLLIALRNQGRLRDARTLLETGTLPALTRREAANVRDDVNEGILGLESGDSRTAAARFVAGWQAPLSNNVSPGMAARYHAWRGTLAGMAIAATGDTTALRRLADTVEFWGQRSIYGRDRRAHHYLRGLLLVAAGRDDDAIREFGEAIHSPTLGFTRVNFELGRVLLRQRRPREAVDVLAPALRGEVDASNLYVTRTELHELLAQAYDALGARDSAAVHYRAVARAWAKADPLFHPRRDAARDWLVRYDVRQSSARSRTPASGLLHADR